MPLAREKLAGKAAADDHIRVVLRAVDALVHREIQLKELVLDRGIRLNDRQRDGQAVVLQRVLQKDRVAVGQQYD